MTAHADRSLSLGPSELPPSSSATALAFEHFLRECFSGPEVIAVLSMRDIVDWRFGQVALRKGYIQGAELLELVAGQAVSNKPLGELFEKRGIMTSDQVEEVLRVQEDAFLQLVESVWIARVASEPEAHALAKTFLLRSSQPPPESTIRPTTRARSTPGLTQTLLRDLKAMATLPAVAQKVLSQLRNSEVRLENVAKTLEADPVLTAQLLRLVNSAFFASRSRITTTLGALKQLGINVSRQLVLTTAVFENFSAKGDSEVLNLWKTAILAGQWSRTLAGSQGPVDPEEAAVAGLLHNLGEIIVSRRNRGASLEINRHIQDGLTRSAAECLVLGMTIPEMGALLMHYWNFAPAISDATACSRLSPTELRSAKRVTPMTLVVNAACHLSRLGLGDIEASISNLDCDFLEMHGLERTTLLALAPEVTALSARLASSLL